MAVVSLLGSVPYIRLVSVSLGSVSVVVAFMVRVVRVSSVELFDGSLLE